MADIVGYGEPTGVFCTESEFKELLEIISEVKKESITQIKGYNNSEMILPKLPTVQADVYTFVRKLAERHGLPPAFYGINKHREFIKVMSGREDDFHDVYSYK